MWDRVVGQERAVTLLQRAAERPVHSYLLAGPRGSGVEDAARCFAAALIAPRDGGAWDRVLRSRHPDVVEVDPPEAILRVEHAATVLEEAHRSPVEGDRKAIVLFDAERLNEQAANKLLKTLEEPPARTVVVLLSAFPDQLLPTIRSRCHRIDLGALSDRLVQDSLEGSGVEPGAAAIAASLAAGRLDRARALAGRLAPVREACVAAAAALDGTGASVAASADRVQDALASTVAALEASQALEADALAGELEDAGYADRDARRIRRRLEERHRREHRRVRTEALLEGITAFETVYRDALAGERARTLNADRPRLTLDPRACADALDACRAARQALDEFNPREDLLLERLLLQLPAATRKASR